MTPEQLTALIVAVTGLVGAFAVVLAQLRATHSLINSRMTELVETTKLAAQKSGELAGRDWQASQPETFPFAAARTALPIGKSPASSPGTEPQLPDATST